MPTKQKSGLYRAKVKIGVDETGKDIYKYVSGKTKRELEAAKQQAIAYYIDGTGLADDVLFGPYAVEWFNVHKRPHIKPSTIGSYKTVFNHHILPEFGDRKLRAITATSIQKFMLSFNGKSALYQTISRTILRGVFDAAIADNILIRNPMNIVKKPLPSKKATEKRALTKGERQRITEACQSNSPDALYVALLYYLGIRRSEAVGLRWGDIDWKQETIRIERIADSHNHFMPGTPKTAASLRTIPIPKPLISLLNAHRAMPDMYILSSRNNTPWSTRRINDAWRHVIVEQCGIPDITPHYLRHNYITMCWEAGIDVYATARFVGHSNVSTTLNIYTHLSKERETESANALRKMFSV